MSLCFFDRYTKNNLHQKLKTFEFKFHICREYWDTWQEYVLILNFFFVLFQKLPIRVPLRIGISRQKYRHFIFVYCNNSRFQVLAVIKGCAFFCKENLQTDVIYTNFYYYLSDRTQRLIFKNNHSQLVHATSGVSLGQHFGPLLFTLFINDLPLFLCNSRTVKLCFQKEDCWHSSSRSR